jgi:hypothetical protein
VNDGRRDSLRGFVTVLTAYQLISPERITLDGKGDVRS